MKIGELLKPTGRPVSGTIQAINPDKTATIVAPLQAPIRPIKPKERSVSPNICPHADANDSMTGDHAPDVNQLPTRSASLSMPHAPDLDLIKAQIAQLPRHARQ
jgi:hypothetical protein